MEKIRYILFNVNNALLGNYKETNPDVLAAIHRVMLRRNATLRDQLNLDFRRVHEEINKSFVSLAKAQDGKQASNTAG